MALKAMVPVSVRGSEDVLGNHISFVFAELPCDEPDPLGRLYRVHDDDERAQARPRARGADLALKAAAHTPVAVQHAISRLDREPAYLQPRRLEHPRPRRAALPARLPAAGHLPGRPARRPPRGLGRHDDGRATAPASASTPTARRFPTRDALARDIDEAITELLAEATSRCWNSAGPP